MSKFYWERKSSRDNGDDRVVAQINQTGNVANRPAIGRRNTVCRLAVILCGGIRLGSSKSGDLEFDWRERSIMILGD